MLNSKIHTTIVALVALAALTSTGVASAASRSTHRSHKQVSHALSVSRTVNRSGGPIVKPVFTGNTVAAISAFPTGGKGSGSEATCSLWSQRLNEEQGEIDAATDNNNLQEYKEAKEAQDADVDNALDAGCVVIY